MVGFLPAYEDLTEAQDQAMRHPGSLLVTGPPGSGKTVIALHRAHELKKKKRRAHVLTFSSVLMSYVSECLQSSGIQDIDKSTFHKWFPGFYYKTYRNRPPKLSKFDFDWEMIEKVFINNGFPKAFDQLIIDEAQDLPVQFLKVSPYISEGVTVFADENQAIFQNNTSLEAIRRALRRFEPEHILLKKNFRNTRQIAKFAALFVTKGIETGAADLPDREGDLPLLCKMSSMNEQVMRIANYMQTIRTRDKTVGIFLPRKEQVRDWQKKLTQACPNTNVQYYISGEKVNGRWLGPPDFSKKGIFIVSDWTAKGLEFDYVFVPDMQNLQNETGQIMRCYVAFSRAKDRLVMMYTGDNLPEIVRERLQAAEAGGEVYAEREGTSKVGNTSEKIFRKTSRSNAPTDSVVLKDFIEYCMNEMDERQYERIQRFFKIVFKDKKKIYTKQVMEVRITSSLPGRLRETMLSLLLQFIKLTNQGEL